MERMAQEEEGMEIRQYFFGQPLVPFFHILQALSERPCFDNEAHDQRCSGALDYKHYRKTHADSPYHAALGFAQPPVVITSTN